MTTLSIAQKEIVHAPIGVSLQVLAAAGSGKTRVLTERISHIFQTKIKEGIIALTFTNKAAEEMLLRLNNFEGIEDRCWISTVHGVAQRILNQYGHTIGLPSELHIYDREQDCKTVFLQSLRNRGINIDEFLNVHDKKTKKEREQIIQRYMEQFSIIKRELLNENEIKEKYINSKNFWQIFVAYQEALLESGGIDFDDILVYSHRILLEQPWCGKIYRTNYKHICVDEAQDLNKAQYEFIKALCSDEITSLMMVGDPNQMIFGFNGSSNDFFCTQFVNDFNPLKFRLNENYRSSKAVIHLSNKLKPGSQIESDFALDGKRFFQNLKDEDSEASWIIDKIKELLQIKNDPEIEGDITLNNIVIIGRNKFVFKKLEECLKNNKIAYSLKKGERQVEPSSLFGKILDLAIRLRLNLKDWVDGKKLCSVLKINPPDTWGNENILQELVPKIIHQNILFPELQIMLLNLIHKLDLNDPNITKFCIEIENKIKELVAKNSQNSSLLNELDISLNELNEFKTNWIIFKKKGLGISLSAFRNAMALGQINEDYKSNGLTLSTVHTMKGLEKDIVFLIGMCEGVFPDYRARNKKEIDEERNSAFVAITRSRRWIYITYPETRIMPWGDVKPQTQSRFITEMLS